MPRYDRSESASGRSYPEVREVLGNPYRNLSSEQIESLLESANINAEDMENFLSVLGNIGRGVVSALPTILPIAGTVAGTAFGGPAGAALGGALGQLAGSAAGSLMNPRQQPSQPQAPTRQPRTPPGGMYPPIGAPLQYHAPPTPAAAPAAGQLIQTLFRPETLQALMAMLLGQAGRPSIPVGNTPVPLGAFTNLLGVLANQAAAEYNAVSAATNLSVGQRTPRYLEDFAGEMRGDPAIPEHRAAALLELLQEAEVEPLKPSHARHPARSAFPESFPETDDQMYDAMELAEMYGEYEGEYEFM